MFKRVSQGLASLVAGSAMVGLLSTGTIAATTPVSGTSFGAGEPTLQQVFTGLYGGTFVGSPSAGFTNGTITAVRLQDDNTDTLDLLAGDLAGDQTFTSAAPIKATAVARFAAASQSFGYFPGTSGGAYSKLFDVTGSGYAVSGSATASIDDVFRFGRVDAQSQSSLPSENGDKKDHLVTFKILGESSLPTYLLFWEDRNSNTAIGTDFDFNDLVVKVTAIPLPAAAWSGLSMLGAMVGGAAWRRARRTA